MLTELFINVHIATVSLRRANCDVWDGECGRNGKCLLAGVSVVELLALLLGCRHTSLLCCMTSFMSLCSVLCNTVWFDKWTPALWWNIQYNLHILCRDNYIDWEFEVLKFCECLHFFDESTRNLHKDGNHPTYTASYSRRPKFSFWYFVKLIIILTSWYNLFMYLYFISACNKIIFYIENLFLGSWQFYRSQKIPIV